MKEFVKKHKKSSVAAAVVLALVFLLTAVPLYKVYTQGTVGQAALARAQQERQILVEQARAERDAAKLRAEAIKIVGEVAKQYPEYRKQEFMGAFAEALKEGNVNQIIYVPTEANIPILEAGNR